MAGARVRSQPARRGDHEHPATAASADEHERRRRPRAGQLAKCRPVAEPEREPPNAAATPSAPSAAPREARPPRRKYGDPPPADDRRTSPGARPATRHRHDQARGPARSPRPPRTRRPRPAQHEVLGRSATSQTSSTDGQVRASSSSPADARSAVGPHQPASSRTARTTAKRRTARARAQCSGAASVGIAREQGPRVGVDALDPRAADRPDPARRSPRRCRTDACLPDPPRRGAPGRLSRCRRRRPCARASRAAAARGRQRIVVHEQAAPGRVAASDASAQLVQLGEAEALRAVDDHQRRLGARRCPPR